MGIFAGMLGAIGCGEPGGQTIANAKAGGTGNASRLKTLQEKTDLLKSMPPKKKRR